MLRGVRRLVLPLILLALWAGDAAGEPVYRGAPVSDARLALGPGGEPVVAYVADGTLTVAIRRAAGWDARSPFVLPARDVEIDGLVVSAGGLPTRAPPRPRRALARRGPQRRLRRMALADDPARRAGAT